MARDIRGIWRGKMNVNFYESFFFRYLQLPQYSGPPVNDPGAPTIWFGLKISSHVDYFAGQANSGSLMVLSGEVGHITTRYGNPGQISLPVNGFYLDDGLQSVHLTFLTLATLRPAHFLGHFTDDNHIDGDWTESHQWNDWTDGAGRNYDNFNFGKMNLQKLFGFKDQADLSTAKHLFSP